MSGKQQVTALEPMEYKLYFREWQRYRGMTIRKASQLIGIAESTYFKWCTGDHWPSSYWLPRMARAFRCGIGDLYSPPPGMRQ